MGNQQIDVFEEIISENETAAIRACCTTCTSGSGITADSNER